MNRDEFDNIISLLSRTVTELEYSVVQAYDQFLFKYGAGHPYSARLESYFPAIDKQREYIDELEKYFADGNFIEFHSVTAKIRALSNMVKEDAKSFLGYISSGESTFTEWSNETVH